MTAASEPTLDVVGVGNAIVDVIGHADDEFLARHDLPKGSMQLVDADRSAALYGDMGPGMELSGGSVANTVVGVVSFGGSAGFVGKVADDQLGEVFTHDIRAAGVEYGVAPVAGNGPTARCLVVVTPDAQRTMSTHLGVSGLLGPDDVDADLPARAAVTMLEGYLWDSPSAREAIGVAIDAARRAGRRVALTLSDRFCVERHRDEFLSLLDGRVDVLFANEAEAVALYEVDDFDTALQRTRAAQLPVAALTRSERGSVIVVGDEVHVVDPVRLGPVVDTTGAGDLYAAGFLYGLTHHADPATWGRLGALAAAEVIAHAGARPEQDLRALAKEAGLLQP